MEPRARVLVLALLAWAGAVPAPARARLLLPQKEALRLAFPGAEPERRTAFLTDAQVRAAEKAAGAKIASAVWTYYAAGSTFAYFDTHPVRTMDETIMVVLGRDGAVRFVEVLAFAEPDDYRAPPRWLEQLEGRRLDDDLALRRGLRGVAGATLTAEAVTKAVRRVLAVHALLQPPAAAK